MVKWQGLFLGEFQREVDGRVVKKGRGGNPQETNFITTSRYPCGVLTEAIFLSVAAARPLCGEALTIY